MPNERNVEALSALLKELYPDGVASWHMGDLAEALASRGVLVSAALTDDEACDLPASKFSAGWTEERAAEEIAREVRADLERIAKGER